MSGFDEVASAFIQHYYATSDSNPAALQSLYQPQSTLTFEGAQVQGPEAIVQKLMVRCIVFAFARFGRGKPPLLTIPLV